MHKCSKCMNGRASGEFAGRAGSFLSARRAGPLGIHRKCRAPGGLHGGQGCLGILHGKQAEGGAENTNTTNLGTDDIKLVISAKVDVRDGVAWSSLDKYIKGIEGGGPGPGAASLPAHHSHDAEAAVAAAGVADNEEELETGATA